MDQQQIAWQVRTAVLLTVTRKTGNCFVPVGISNRHIHLCQRDLDVLFGPGYQLTPIHPLTQPGQFAAKETVTVAGPKGKIEKMRVLGPLRPETQIEISVTDSFGLGVAPVIRMSGYLKDTPGAEVIGPAGRVRLSGGVIVAARHLHISGDEAAVYGLKDGDVIGLKSPGERELIFRNVLVRCGSSHELEVHLDTDEANAAHIKNGDMLEIVR